MFMGYGMTVFLGIGYGYEKLDYTRKKTCAYCGKEGNEELFLTYMSLSVFFHPLIKWHKRYYLQMDCCGHHEEINDETVQL